MISDQNSVKTGLDTLVETNFSVLKGMRLGVIANHSAIDPRGQHLIDILSEQKEFKLVRLFSPEHGFRGYAQDMEEIDNYTDPKTSLPVVSLYGSEEESLVPSAKSMEDIDGLVFDIQDVGSRYYTYANTLAYTMRRAAELGKKVIVLDRPNPIGGDAIEGSPLENSCKSFCGYAPIANRHGMTVGELADLFNSGFKLGQGEATALNCDLEVIETGNWKRSMYFDQTNQPWVYPSPNMPTLETALVYPGGCLFEATNLSEGRGTTKPFELIGAPYINSDQWIDLSLKLYSQLIDGKTEGFFLRATSFFPKFQKWSQTTCHGVQIHISDRNIPFSYRLCLAMIAAAKSLYPKDFSWRKEEYEFKTDISPIDILYGSSNFRLQLDKNPEDLSTIASELANYEVSFKKARNKFLRY